MHAPYMTTAIHVCTIYYNYNTCPHYTLKLQYMYTPCITTSIHANTIYYNYSTCRNHILQLQYIYTRCEGHACGRAAAARLAGRVTNPAVSNVHAPYITTTIHVCTIHHVICTIYHNLNTCMHTTTIYVYTIYYNYRVGGHACGRAAAARLAGRVTNPAVSNVIAAWHPTGWKMHICTIYYNYNYTTCIHHILQLQYMYAP